MKGSSKPSKGKVYPDEGDKQWEMLKSKGFQIRKWSEKFNLKRWTHSSQLHVSNTIFFADERMNSIMKPVCHCSCINKRDELSKIAFCALQLTCWTKSHTRYSYRVSFFRANATYRRSHYHMQEIAKVCNKEMLEKNRSISYSSLSLIPMVTRRMYFTIPSWHKLY